MCLHLHRTFPISPRSGPRAGQTYVVCLDCGEEREYDWERMCLGERIDTRSSSPARAHATPSLKQMLLAPFLLAMRLYRASSKWMARHVLPHIHLSFPHWRSR